MSKTVAIPKTEVGGSGEAELHSTQRKRILLAEGDGFTRLVLLLLLRLEGFAVDFTSNGTIARARLGSCRPDALLVELKLSGASGLDLIRAARADSTFGDRPIYVFTHGDRIKRTTSRELGRLGATLFDKNLMTREAVVQSLVASFTGKPALEQPRLSARAAPPPQVLSKTVPPEAIEEIIAGVRDQAERLAQCKETGDQLAGLNELHSRVCSLAICAGAAGLLSLSWQAKALENLLNQLSARKQACSAQILSLVNRSLELMSGMCSKRKGKEQSRSQLSAVVVDEEPLSNRALKQGLLNAGFAPLSFVEPARARTHLATNRTELIVVNLSFPEGHRLDLGSIRQLPLHSKTPIIFGPHPAAGVPLEEQLPAGARLDSEPVLLAEVILEALNEVQSAPESAPSVLRRVFARPHSVPSRSFEDCVQDDPSAIPGMPGLRSQPAAAGADCTAEFLTILPASPVDGSRPLDEQPVEALPPAALQVEPIEPPQPEPTVEDRTGEAPWLTAAAGEIGQPVLAGDTALQFQPNDPAAVQQSANIEEVMNHPLQAGPAEYVQQGEPSQPGELSSQRQDAEARCAELERQLASISQAFADFNGGFDQQQHALAEAAQHAQDLEQQLNQATAELEKQREEQQRAEADLRRELESVQAASQESEAARQQAEARCVQLEQELGGLRQAQADLADKLSREQKANAEPGAASAQSPADDGAVGAPASELEHQVRQGVAALARATADLAKERGERQRSDQRVAVLNERLQTLHQDLKRLLEAQREDLARISALEEQQRETNQALDQRTAELEQEQVERRLAEEQLEKAKEVNARLRKDLAFFEEANKKSGGSREELQTRLAGALRENEARLQKESAERQQLAQSLEEVQRQLQEESRRRETLEQEIHTAREALADREAKLQKETAERQRLSETLAAVQRSSHDGLERDLELSKLQSALEAEQVERKRQETQLAHLRDSARNAAQAARTLRTSLRRQIRLPVENLVHSTRSLLELELGEAQKQLAESVLQDVLLVRTRLWEPELAHGEPAEATAPATARTT